MSSKPCPPLLPAPLLLRPPGAPAPGPPTCPALTCGLSAGPLSLRFIPGLGSVTCKCESQPGHKGVPHEEVGVRPANLATLAIPAPPCTEARPRPGWVVLSHFPPRQTAGRCEHGTQVPGPHRGGRLGGPGAGRAHPPGSWLGPPSWGLGPEGGGAYLSRLHPARWERGGLQVRAGPPGLRETGAGCRGLP